MSSGIRMGTGSTPASGTPISPLKRGLLTDKTDKFLAAPRRHSRWLYGEGATRFFGRGHSGLPKALR